MMGSSPDAGHTNEKGAADISMSRPPQGAVKGTDVTVNIATQSCASARRV